MVNADVGDVPQVVNHCTALNDKQGCEGKIPNVIYMVFYT